MAALSLKGPLGPAIDSNDSTRNTLRSMTTVAATPTWCDDGNRNTHVPRRGQPQHPHAATTMATTPMHHDNDGRNTHALQ
jgi:hypothetical protein